MSAHSLNDLIDYLKIDPSHLTLIIASLFACALLFAGMSVVAYIKDKNQLSDTLSDVSATLFAISLMGFALAASFVDSKQDKHAGYYTITHDETYLYINSQTKYLESAKLKIVKQDKNYIYAQKGDKTYKIPQIQDK